MQRSMPTLFGTRPGLMSRLSTQGTIPVVGSLLGTAGRAVSGVAGTAWRALSGVTGIAGSAVGGVFQLLGTVSVARREGGGSVLQIGVSAVTAAGRLVLHLGQAAISTLVSLGETAGRNRREARRHGEDDRRAGGRGRRRRGGRRRDGRYAYAKKAVADTADEAYQLRENAMATGTGGLG